MSPAPFLKLQRLSIGISLLAIAASVASCLGHPERFFEAWLVGWFFWFSVAVGCMAFFMIYRLTGGEWGKSTERIFISGGKTFELLVVLFIPLVSGFHELYSWTVHANLITDPLLRYKEPYLNIPFWCARAAFYFAVWIGLAALLERSRSEGVRRWSAGGFVALFLTGSFAGVDWIMTLEPGWYSTVYGMIILTGQGLAGFAFSLLAMHFIRTSHPRWNPPFTAKVLKDQGNLFLTASVLWTYVSFVQWLIIWIGNEPETATWYTSRATGGWATLAWVVFIGQFLIPFQLLLFQRFKTSTARLAGLSAFVLVIHLFEVYWLVVPALHPGGFYFNGVAILTWLGIGGLWLSFFLYRLKTLTLSSVGNDYTQLLGELLL